MPLFYLTTKSQQKYLIEKNRELKNKLRDEQIDKCCKVSHLQGYKIFLQNQIKELKQEIERLIQENENLKKKELPPSYLEATKNGQ